jgi:hypothetical protein
MAGIHALDTFVKMGGRKWIEETPGIFGCLKTHYDFKEESRDDAWIVLKDDGGRNMYVRLPRAGAGTSYSQWRMANDVNWIDLHFILTSLK